MSPLYLKFLDFRSDCWNDVDETEFACSEKKRFLLKLKPPGWYARRKILHAIISTFLNNISSKIELHLVGFIYFHFHFQALKIQSTQKELILFQRIDKEITRLSDQTLKLVMEDQPDFLMPKKVLKKIFQKKLRSKKRIEEIENQSMIFNFIKMNN